MKTSILIALAIALATGLRFLGELFVTRPCRVLVLSGESGLGTLQETAQRICKAMGVQLAELKNLVWSDVLPNLDNVRHLARLERMIQKTACEVLILDPAYLCMPGSDAGNLFVQGSLLRRVSDICQRHGVGMILAHHTRKRDKTRRNADYQAPELDDLSWSGFAEFARQWILIGRREDFVPGSGEHRLWLSVGGSAGHSALWALDIDEGVSGMPRHWKTKLSPASEVRAEKAEKKASQIEQRLLDAARHFPDGETQTQILAQDKRIKCDAAAKDALNALVAKGLLVECKVSKKNGATYSGFRPSPEALKACGEAA